MANPIGTSNVPPTQLYAGGESATNTSMTSFGVGNDGSRIAQLQAMNAAIRGDQIDNSAGAGESMFTITNPNG